MVLLAILFLNSISFHPIAKPFCDLSQQQTISTTTKNVNNMAPLMQQRNQIFFQSSKLATLDEITKRPKQESSWIWWISFVGHPFTQWMLITILAVTAIWRHQIRRRETRRRWEQEEKTETSALEETRRQYTIH